MSIEIHIPRPLLTLGVIAVAVWFTLGGRLAWQPDTNESVQAQVVQPQEEDIDEAAGGSDGEDVRIVREAEETVRDLRVKQEVLSRREEILRYELGLLELENSDDPLDAATIQERRRELVALLQDKQKAEEQILASLQQMWDARGFALTISKERRGGTRPQLLAWPVEPLRGISAHFEDAGYRKRFGFDHHAVDIPTSQGTIIFAPADGIVAQVSDNGLGFSSLTVDHGGGMATLYGHVSEFLVTEGQQVRKGDPIAKSGGQPGGKGSGRITTGPHLHFEVLIDGEKADPLQYLEESPNVKD